MPKNIIFDWSGVIKDAIDGHLWIVNRIFKKFGTNEISLEELKENWEQPYMLFYNKYLPNLTIEEEQTAYREALFHKDCPDSKVFPGITEFIKKLKRRNIFLGVISSDLADTVLPEIKKYDLEDIFDDVITDAHDKVEAVRNLIKKHNISQDETFFIGDSNHEIEAGKQTGIKTIAVTWGFITEQKLKLKKPDFIVHNLEELKKLFHKMNINF